MAGSLPLDSVAAFQSVGSELKGSVSGLALANGVTYVAAVRATNGAGLTATATSNGVLINTAAPDSTSILECYSDLSPETSVRVGSTTTLCHIVALSGGNAVKALASEFSVSLAAASNADAADSDGTEVGTVTAVTPVTADGYEMTFSYVAPAATRALSLSVRVAGAHVINSPLELTVVDYPDATSTLTCTPSTESLVSLTPGYVRRSASILCSLVPRKAGVKTRCVAGDLRISVDLGELTSAGVPGAVGDSEDPTQYAWVSQQRGREFLTYYHAPAVGNEVTFSASYLDSRGDFSDPAAVATVYIVAYPTTASSVVCTGDLTPSSSLRIMSYATCTLTVMDGAGVARALPGDFFAASITSGGFVGDLTTNNKGLTFTFQYQVFDMSVLLGRLAVVLQSSASPITSSPVSLNVALIPDSTTTVKCQSTEGSPTTGVISEPSTTGAVVAYGTTVDCFIDVRNGTATANAVPADFTVSAQEGSVGAVSVDGTGTVLTFSYTSPKVGDWDLVEVALAETHTPLTPYNVSLVLSGASTNSQLSCESNLVAASPNSLSVRRDESMDCTISLVDRDGDRIKGIVSDVLITPSFGTVSGHQLSDKGTVVSFRYTATAPAGSSSVALSDTLLAQLAINDAVVTDGLQLIHIADLPSRESVLACTAPDADYPDTIVEHETLECTITVYGPGGVTDGPRKAVAGDFEVVEFSDSGVASRSPLESSDGGLTFTFTVTAQAYAQAVGPEPGSALLQFQVITTTEKKPIDGGVAQFTIVALPDTSTTVQCSPMAPFGYGVDAVEQAVDADVLIGIYEAMACTVVPRVGGEPVRSSPSLFEVYATENFVSIGNVLFRDPVHVTGVVSTLTPTADDLTLRFVYTSGSNGTITREAVHVVVKNHTWSHVGALEPALAVDSSPVRVQLAPHATAPPFLRCVGPSLPPTSIPIVTGEASCWVFGWQGSDPTSQSPDGTVTQPMATDSTGFTHFFTFTAVDRDLALNTATVGVPNGGSPLLTTIDLVQEPDETSSLACTIEFVDGFVTRDTVNTCTITMRTASTGVKAFYPGSLLVATNALPLVGDQDIEYYSEDGGFVLLRLCAAAVCHGVRGVDDGVCVVCSHDAVPPFPSNS